MKITKQQRESLYKKYGGRCAYCGCSLIKGWHVDHIVPVIRIRKSYKDAYGKPHYYISGTQHPELETIENMNPSCASCNINKRGQTLEKFRDMITKFMIHLNESSVQYKIAKRYGLVKESGVKVVFYFEYYNEWLDQQNEQQGHV